MSNPLFTNSPVILGYNSMQSKKLSALFMIWLMISLLIQSALVSAAITGVSSYTEYYSGIKVQNVHSELGKMTFEVTFGSPISYTPVFKLDGETVSGTCSVVNAVSVCKVTAYLYADTSSTYSKTLEVYDGSVRKEGPYTISGIKQDTSVPSVTLSSPADPVSIGEQVNLGFKISDSVDSGIYALEVVFLDKSKADISPLPPFKMEGKKISM